MKKYILKSIVLTILVVLSSCTAVDFGDTNVDPNSPNQALAGPLLSGGMLNIRNIYGATRPSLYVQYLSNEQYEDESLYKTQRFDYATYYASITNLNKVIELNTNSETKSEAIKFGSNNNQIAVANLVKAYYFQFMTDNWGMLPYLTANKGTEVEFNKFDSQETIYNSLFTEIEKALSLIDLSSDGPTGDILFRGDMNKWKIFGNSLMMNMALRLSKKAPTVGKKYFNIAKNNGVISSNNENIYFSNSVEYQNPWYVRFVVNNRSDYLLSDTFVNALIGSGTNTAPEDPRLAKYGKKADDTGVFNGAPYGDSNSNTKAFSFITDDITQNQTSKAPIYTYAQMLFNMAEAAQLGWTTSDTAENYYKKGIEASMGQWSVDSTDISTYTSSRPAFDGMKSIAYEKWVALYLQGYEAWFDWRKQGSDQVSLTKPAAALTQGIPNRQAYPLTAISSNKENYDAAVAAQGEDNLDTKVWWAK